VRLEGQTRMNLQMSLVLLVSTAAYISIGLAVGVRVVRLARRTGGFPERMLGISCLAGPGFLAPCMVVVHAVAEPEALVRTAAFLGQVAYALFCTVMVLFTWQCFRPDDAWARWLARLSIVVVVFAASAGAARALGLAPTLALRDMNHWAFRLIGIVSLVGHAWTGLEAFGYYGLMRKRSKLGLADPVVTNRFLLWGVIAVCAILASGVPLVVSLLGGDSFHNVPTRLVGAAATITGTACLQLAFLPPRFYVRWLAERAAAGAA
jgi:hypothetical protein